MKNHFLNVFSQPLKYCRPGILIVFYLYMVRWLLLHWKHLRIVKDDDENAILEILLLLLLFVSISHYARSLLAPLYLFNPDRIPPTPALGPFAEVVKCKALSWNSLVLYYNWLRGSN